MLASESIGAALAVFALVGTCYARAQEVSPDHSPIKLAVTTSSVRYCESDSEVYTAQYYFFAEYRNISDKPLTLVVGSEVPSKLVAAADERDLAAGVLQLRMDLESYPADAGNDAILGENVRREKTALVRSGQSVHSKIQVSLPVRKVTTSIPGTVEAGRHVLVVEVALRGKVPADGPDGFRWVSVRSQPVLVDVPVKERLQRCGN